MRSKVTTVRIAAFTLPSSDGCSAHSRPPPEEDVKRSSIGVLDVASACGRHPSRLRSSSISATSALIAALASATIWHIHPRAVNECESCPTPTPPSATDASTRAAAWFEAGNQRLLDRRHRPSRPTPAGELRHPWANYETAADPGVLCAKTYHTRHQSSERHVNGCLVQRPDAKPRPRASVSVLLSLLRRQSIGVGCFLRWAYRWARARILA
jgi:hypothetical protein